MKNPLKVLSPNLEGRDFVVGDIHGSYSILQNLFKNIKFDKKVDRLITVGDVIDRGPGTFECMSLLLEPWFHTVKGNHEQMMIDAFAGQNGYMWLRNGGSWAIEALNDWKAKSIDRPDFRRIPLDSSVDTFELLEFMKELPYLITVETKSGKKYHIIHAELPNHSGHITDEDLANSDMVELLATTWHSHPGPVFLWSRDMYYFFYEADLSDREDIINTVKSRNLSMFNDKLSHVISGHTQLRRPMTILNQTNIDTSAVNSIIGTDDQKEWASMTCIELDTWTFYRVTEERFDEVDPFIVTLADLYV